MSKKLNQILDISEIDKISAEAAIRAFFLYQRKYLQGADAFILPKWFIDARNLFTKEEINTMYNEEISD